MTSKSEMKRLAVQTDLVKRLRDAVAGKWLGWPEVTEAADRIEELELALCDRHTVQSWEERNRIEELERENAALRADAERYRYLRQIDRLEQWENLLMVRPVWGTEAIDAAIDAAREKP